MININPNNYKSENILSIEEILPILEKLKKEGRKIGLCTGSFDLLHPGHITHFISAKKMCDVLIVGLAVDDFSKNKRIGTGRPIYSHDIRAFMVSNLKPVDFVIFDDGHPTRIIELIKPDFYIKGSDYSKKDAEGILYGKNVVESYRGKIVFTEDEKLSTGDIIKHIKENIK